MIHIEDQAFSPSYLAPPPPPPSSPFSKLDRLQTRRLRKRDNLLTGGGSQILRQREILVLYKHSLLSGGGKIRQQNSQL
jgi:hypothetical protein